MKINTITKVFITLGFAIVSIVMAGCGAIRIGNASFGYDLKGATIDPKCKTAFIDYFKNQAAIVQPLLAQKLTEKLKDKILSQTSLKLVTNTGDVNFQGTIESYNTMPMAPQAGTVPTAAMNRLTVSIKVKYTNAIDNKWEYETSFSRYVDYPANTNLSDIENSSSGDYNDMLDKLIQDIFDKAFVNW